MGERRVLPRAGAAAGRVLRIGGLAADALLGTGQNQGFNALVRGLRERLNGMPAGDRPRRLSAALAGLLLRADERADEWEGDEDFLSVGWARDGQNPLRSATLLTENGSILHVRGDDLTLGAGVPEGEVVQGLQMLADPLVIGG